MQSWVGKWYISNIIMFHLMSVFTCFYSTTHTHKWCTKMEHFCLMLGLLADANYYICFFAFLRNYSWFYAEPLFLVLLIESMRFSFHWRNHIAKLRKKRRKKKRMVRRRHSARKQQQIPKEITHKTKELRLQTIFNCHFCHGFTFYLRLHYYNFGLYNTHSLV